MSYTAASVPKSLNRHSSQLSSFMSARWGMWAVVFATALTACLLFILLYSNTIIILFFALVALGLISVWFLCFRSTEKIDKTGLILKYLYRSTTGQTVLPKYDMPVEYIEKYFPIHHIHKGGVIEFSDDMYGCIMKMAPSRIDEDSMETHLASVQAALNSIPPGDILKTFAASRRNLKKPITDKILEAANQERTTAPQQQHLYSLHSDVSKSDTGTVNWDFWAILCFKADSVDNAQVMAGVRLPGLKKAFRKAGAGLSVLTDPTDIGLSYYQMIRDVEVHI
jgi:hypothetical protein